MPPFASREFPDLLERFKPLTEYETHCKQTMLAFFASYPHFNREPHVGHFTASALVLDPLLKKCALVLHKKLGIWVQPGGHCEGDQDLLSNASREALEECGLETIPLSREIFDLDIHWIPPNPREKGHFHFDVRFILKACSPHLKVSQESLDVCWCDLEQASVPVDASVERMKRKAKDALMRFGHKPAI